MVLKRWFKRGRRTYDRLPEPYQDAMKKQGWKWARKLLKKVLRRGR